MTGRGVRHYDPDYAYAPRGDALYRVAQLVTGCVAALATRYRAEPEIGAPPREGDVPTDPEAASQLIDELYRWQIEVLQGRRDRTGLVLSRGKRIILVQSRDILPELRLTPSEFKRVQRCLVQRGLLATLYFDTSERRAAVVNTYVDGALVRQSRLFSPGEWEQHSKIPPLPEPPAEEEQLEAFTAACDAFEAAVRRRLAEIHEPGKPMDVEGDSLLRHLRLLVQFARMRAAGDSAAPAYRRSVVGSTRYIAELLDKEGS